MAGEGIQRLFKSRYGSISTFIYSCGDEEQQSQEEEEEEEGGKEGGKEGRKEGGKVKATITTEKEKRKTSAIDRYNDIPCEVDKELQVGE